MRQVQVLPRARDSEFSWRIGGLLSPTWEVVLSSKHATNLSTRCTAPRIEQRRLLACSDLNLCVTVQLHLPVSDMLAVFLFCRDITADCYLAVRTWTMPTERAFNAA